MVVRTDQQPRARILGACVVVWGLLPIGCGREVSVTPAPTPSASPAPETPGDPGQQLLPGERWQLMTTLTSVRGPDVCWAPATKVGKSDSWLMAVQRSGQSIRLAYDVRHFPVLEVDHVGTVVEYDFTAATSEGWTGAFACGDVRNEFRFEAHVTGRFSADGGTLTATEVWSYRLTSGETVSLRYDWKATPIDRRSKRAAIRRRLAGGSRRRQP